MASVPQGFPFLHINCRDVRQIFARIRLRDCCLLVDFLSSFGTSATHQPQPGGRSHGGHLHTLLKKIPAFIFYVHPQNFLLLPDKNNSYHSLLKKNSNLNPHGLPDINQRFFNFRRGTLFQFLQLFDNRFIRYTFIRRSLDPTS